MQKKNKQHLIPFDIEVKAKDGSKIVFAKGLELTTFIKAAERWYNEAAEAYFKTQDFNRDEFKKFINDMPKYIKENDARK